MAKYMQMKEGPKSGTTVISKSKRSGLSSPVTALARYFQLQEASKISREEIRYYHNPSNETA